MSLRFIVDPQEKQKQQKKSRDITFNNKAYIVYYLCKVYKRCILNEMT